MINRPLLLLLPVLVACSSPPGGESELDAGPSVREGGADAGSPMDAGVPDAGGPVVDGGSCPTVTSCPCFSNHDCPAAFRCESQDESGDKIYCVAGPRGTRDAGEDCVGEGDCQSALCIDHAVVGEVCSDLCQTSADCPASLPRCLYVGFGVDASLCSPAPP